ncbi:MAG TPA: FGGY family carbohydrate kinase [Atribacterota bacterium]|nr:FGGY family carbohydrate kinase [Atribacterota bacterium]
MRVLILCIDLGTTGCHTVIFDEKGQQVSRSYQEYKSIYLPGRWIDHDPKTWLQAVKKTVKETVKKIEYDKNCISAVAVTSQRATVVPVDKKGNPLDNAILWQDKRAIEETQHLINEYGTEKIYNITGLRVDPYFTLPKLLWLKKNKPEIYNHSFIFLPVQDFIIHFLTGEFKTDWTQASRTMLFNIDELRWDKDLIKSVGIDFNKLPEAVPPGSIIGLVNHAASVELGLPKGIPVITAGGDQQCAAIGLGVIKPGIVEVSTGTGSFVLASSDKPVKDFNQRLICSASSIAGKWVLEAGIFTTGSIFRWFRDNIGQVPVKNKIKSGMNAYQIMDSEAEKEPLGANGLLLIPHFAASAAPYWNPEARGVLFGLSLGHKRSSIIRAILEGIAFEIQKNISIMESYTDQIKEVRISGGLTRSEIFNQIQADIYGKTVIKTDYEEASVLGAAVVAATTTGLYDNINSAVDNMINVNNLSRKEPNMENYTVYKELSKIHDSLYWSLEKAGIYSKMNKAMRLL